MEAAALRQGDNHASRLRTPMPPRFAPLRRRQPSQSCRSVWIPILRARRTEQRGGGNGTMSSSAATMDYRANVDAALWTADARLADPPSAPPARQPLQFVGKNPTERIRALDWCITASP